MMSRSAARAALVVWLLAGGCYQLAGYDDIAFRAGMGGSVPIGGGSATGTGTTSDGGQSPTLEPLEPSRVAKLDLLLVLDNSPGMADKQELVASMLDRLFARLLNPLCLHRDGTTATAQPAEATEPCPEAGSAREFPPLRDMHVGVLSSSLGGHGSDSCDPDAAANPRLDDRAHLLASRADGSPVDSYQGLGFLAWDPDGAHEPPGLDDETELTSALQAIVGGVGESGCAFEAPLESWYRFLVDPEPYEELLVDAQGRVERVGVDDELLAQRASFLRVDSSLVIVVVSDENDCSIQDRDRYYQVAQVEDPDGGGLWRMPRGRAECQLDPGDPCCLPCGSTLPEGCAADGPECATPLSAAEDPISLRCLDQRRRFGADFLYDLDRYYQALSESNVTPIAGEWAPNPIVPPDSMLPVGAPRRHQGAVVLMAVAGVPWQDISRRIVGTGYPDLDSGSNSAGEVVGGLQTSSEIDWPILLSSVTSVPADQLMIESIDPRSNVSVHPILGVQVAPPTAGYMANPINGHERLIPGRDDLQYACIFDRGEPVDCALPGAPPACACGAGFETNPLCQDVDGSYSTVQRAAAAYPSVRQLRLVQKLAARGIVASACPAQRQEPAARSFELNAAADALADVLREHFKQQYCLAHELDADDEGNVPCRLFEASDVAEATCCGGAARRAPDAQDADVVDQIEQLPAFVEGGWSCLCELPQLEDPQLEACQHDHTLPIFDPVYGRVHGWCYLDKNRLGAITDESLMPGCLVPLPRAIRLVGDAAPREGAALFLWCE